MFICYNYSFIPATVLNVSEGVFAIPNSYGLQFRTVLFANETRTFYIFSLQAVLKVGAQSVGAEGRRRRRADGEDEDSCSIVLVGENSEFILVSNPVRSAEINPLITSVQSRQVS